MKKAYNRRVFLKDSSKAALAAGIGISLIPSVVVAAAGNEFEQQPLPYAYGALEPYIDAMTMEIHYTKHAAAYAKNLAEACTAEKVDPASAKLEDVLMNISKYSTKMRNNGGGHWNHQFFWESLGNNHGTHPGGDLAAAIDAAFGSFDAFKEKFAQAGMTRFGSGWAWLIVKDGKLEVSSTPNQDNPLMEIADVKGTPILGADIWEHAYYLKYQNKRADYLHAFWNVVNWNKIAERFEAATK